MTWRIPPVGWCAVCLVNNGEERAAATLVNGTSLCQTHARRKGPKLLPGIRGGGRGGSREG